MPRDILSEYGNDSPQPQADRLDNGGDPGERDVMDYQPPYGPIGIMRPGAPGLGGANLGNRGSQGLYSSRTSGAKQTTPPIGDGGAGRPGIGGSILNDGLDQDDTGKDL